jgi:hypothetical protein
MNQPIAIGNIYACKGGQKTDYWIVVGLTDTVVNCVGTDKEGRITSTANYLPHVFNGRYTGYPRPVVGRCEGLVGIKLKLNLKKQNPPLASAFIA